MTGQGVARPALTPCQLRLDDPMIRPAVFEVLLIGASRTRGIDSERGASDLEGGAVMRN